MRLRPLAKSDLTKKPWLALPSGYTAGRFRSIFFPRRSWIWKAWPLPRASAVEGLPEDLDALRLYLGAQENKVDGLKPPILMVSHMPRPDRILALGQHKHCRLCTHFAQRSQRKLYFVCGYRRLRIVFALCRSRGLGVSGQSVAIIGDQHGKSREFPNFWQLL